MTDRADFASAMPDSGRSRLPRQSDSRLGQSALQHLDGADLRHISRNGDFRCQHVARAVEQPLFVKREWLIDLNLQEALEDLRGFEKIAALQLLPILLGAH